MRRKVGALLIAVIAILGTLSAALYSIPSFVTTPEGVPISDTVFSEFVYTVSDSVVLPQVPIVETNHSITMTLHFESIERVNESVAVNASLDFIEQTWYLSGHNFSIDSGWTILDGVRWRFRFIDETDGRHVYIGVNAFSGKVDSFTCGWIPDETNSTTPSTSEVEQVVLDFLNHFNYTLSPYARYTGPELFYDHGFHRDVYTMIFRNVVSGTKIDSSYVAFYVDTGANAVQRFSYSWFHIESIPLERIISPEQAAIEASDYIKINLGFSTFTIESATLMFDRNWSPTGQTYTYRLAWIISINSDRVTSVAVDAISGNCYDSSEQMIGPFPTTSGVDFSPIVLFVIALISAFSGFTIWKYRTRENKV